MTQVEEARPAPASSIPEWSVEAYRLLRARGTSVFTYVPDAGHGGLITQANEDPEVIALPLTCEEEGIAVQAGVHLGGGKGVQLMQSSGVGNCINFLSLIKHCRFPFLTIVTMRGEVGEQNPWQYPMGLATEQVLQAMGVVTLRVETPDDVAASLAAAIDTVDKGGLAVAVVFTQRMLGFKSFPASPEPGVLRAGTL